MSPKTIYQKENNLTQSPTWASFQRGYGRKTEEADGWLGIRLGLSLGFDLVWFPKAPEKMTDAFIAEVGKLDTVFVRVEPSELTETEIKKYAFKKVGPNSLLCGQASPKATWILDLTMTEEDLLAQMKPKTRYNIRLAEKKGVRVKCSDDADVLYEMLTATSGKKTGYFPHEKEYYTKMIEELGKNDSAHIYVAEYQGDPLAAIMVTHVGKVATYLHGGQSEKDRNLMAPYLCQWTAIKEAKARGCELYDFWGVAESDDPNDPWAGITRFKEGFGGEKVVYPGTYDLVLKPFWYNVLTMAAKIKHLVRR